MPRRNVLILAFMVLVAVLCRARVQTNPYVRVLAGVMTTIEDRALDPVGEQKLFEGAMNGMLGQLDDYSVYLSPKKLPAFHKEVDLQFAGIGVDIVMDPKTKELTVAPWANSPASTAGILTGDRILRIDKAGAQGLSLSDAYALLRGKKGAAVTLTVMHEGTDKPQEITIVRENVQGESVRGDTRDADGTWEFFLDGRDRIGYLRITTFTENTVNELRQALAWTTQQGMRGLVLDLRDNPGGYLDAGIGVCDLLIPSGVIVTTRGRNSRESHRANGKAPFTVVPVAVVVNDQTASAAEIVAACLQDHHRAAIVGQRTYGKGTVQDLIELEQGCGVMKLTTKSYWRPSGKDIQRPRNASASDDWGVSPDKGCQVAFSDGESERWREWRIRRDVHQDSDKTSAAGDKKPFVDRQRLRAVEYVEKEAAKRENSRPIAK
jgi:carboxyl-terminal processing protease